MVRESSAESHQAYKASGDEKTDGERILEYLGSLKGWATRLMISEHIGKATATVSGLVRPMVRDGVLEESTDKFPCPLSPRKSKVYWVRIPAAEPEKKSLI